MLGSRSPRRLELLRQVHPADLIEVVPPASTAEAGFVGLHDWPSIEARLLEIAATKCDDVVGQVRVLSPPSPLAGEGLGVRGRTLTRHRSPTPRRQSSWPPTRSSSSNAAETCTCWASRLPTTRGRTPSAAGSAKTSPARRISSRPRSIVEQLASGKRASRVVTSRVTFVADVDRWLDWYLATEESRGKAGRLRPARRRERLRLESRRQPEQRSGAAAGRAARHAGDTLIYCVPPVALPLE